MNIQRNDVPLTDNKISANDIVEKQNQQIQDDKANVLNIDLNATYKFGDAEVTGEQLQNWASLGKLDSSERVQTERDRLRQEKDQWLTEARQKESELSQYKTQAEMYQKQLEQFQSLLPREEEQSAIEQLFEQYEQPMRRRVDAEQAEEGYQQQSGDTMNILRQALEAQMQDVSKLIDSRLSQIDTKLETVPSREELQTITTQQQQQQQEQQRQQQLYNLTTANMKEVEGRLVAQRGWTADQAHDYSILREQITGLSRQLDEASSNPQNFATLYSHIQTLDSQSEELKEKFDSEAQAKQNSEQDVAMTQTWRPVNQVIRPSEDDNDTTPKYVTNREYRTQQLRDARDILKKHKIAG